VHLDDSATEAATRLLELGGASAASRQRNLDPALAQHPQPSRCTTRWPYKARVIGQNLLHGTPVPANALLLNHTTRLVEWYAAQRGFCSTNRRQEHRTT